MSNLNDQIEIIEEKKQKLIEGMLKKLYIYLKM